jgi:YegS/Rv2252/BmrU family lipid kinase
VKLAIIANPISGRGRPFKKISHLVKRWPYQDWTADLHETRCPEHAGEIAHELLSDPPDRLAVSGGDGTVHEVVTRVPKPPFPVALLPSGTGNVLAHELGLPLDPVKSMDIALQGKVRHVDLGILKARQSHNFLLMTGVGFDAYVVSKVRPALKMRIGIASFYLQTLKAMLSYGFPKFEVHIQQETLTATSCVISNARSYGGGLVLTPEADMCDGILDLLLLLEGSKLDYCRFILSAWLGKPRVGTSVQIRRASEIRVEGPRGPWVQADGELIGTLPLEISLTPAVFPLVVPSE